MVDHCMDSPGSSRLIYALKSNLYCIEFTNN